MRYQFVLLWALLGGFSPTYAQSPSDNPDVVIRKISDDVLTILKNDKALEPGKNLPIGQIVEQKIIPVVDFPKMTQLTLGRYWRQASTEQQQQLTEEFRKLLVHTYSGALAQARDKKIEIKAVRPGATDSDAEVRTVVVGGGSGEPLQINYRLEKGASGWKIYDVNIMGAWLVESYKGSFSTEVGRSGISGLIQTLSDKNARLAKAAK